MRNQRQREAAESWEANNYRGLIAAGTGWGKTKCALVDCWKRYSNSIHKPAVTLYVTPTETLRDDDWPREIKTYVNPAYARNFKGICWASLARTDLSGYDMLILDEVHHITAMHMPNLEGFGGAIVSLSATPPHEQEKAEMIRTLSPMVYKYSLEQGIQEDINAPYDFHLIYISPDILLKEIPAGSKTKPFMQTEFAAHDYLNKAVKRAAITGDLSGWKGKALIRKRMQLIYNSATKRKAARHILSKVYAKDKRILVFGGSIEQISTLLPSHSYHSNNKGTAKENLLKSFREKDINILGVVGMVDEGANISDLDIGVIIQATESERRVVQRLGRMVRLREGYRAQVYGICLRGTQDQKWFDNAISSLPSHRVKRFSYDSLEHFKNTDEWIIPPQILPTT
jgi:superfamily II DNA or RNA helicase